MKSMRDMTEPELADYFNHLAAMVESVLPAGSSHSGHALFVLLVFDDPKITQYVSNCDRANIVQALRECADRLEYKEIIQRVAFPATPEEN